MKISIIVAIYNVEKYLNECCDSLLNQTVREGYEVILVDDGSTDSCPQICDDYAEKYDFISVIHKKNGGLVSARKAGVIVAQGDYIVSVDGDDWVSDNLIEELIKVIDTKKYDVIAYDMNVCHKNTITISHNNVKEGEYLGLKLQDLKDNLFTSLVKNIVNVRCSLWSNCIKKNILIDIQLRVLNDIGMGEDLAVSYPSIYSAESFYYLKMPLYNYRTDNVSICRSNNPNKKIKIAVLLHYLYSLDFSEGMKDTIKYYVGNMIKLQICTAVKYAKSTKDVLDEIDFFLQDDLIFEKINELELDKYAMKDKIFFKLFKNRKRLMLTFYAIVGMLVIKLRTKLWKR